MSNLGNAYVLASALYARDRSLPLEWIADGLYMVVDAMEFGCDERKADLYAQLAEKLEADTGFEEAVSIVETAMNNTDARYPQ